MAKKAKPAISAKEALRRSKKLKQLSDLQDASDELDQILYYIDMSVKQGDTSLKINNIIYPENRRYLERLGYTIVTSDSNIYKVHICWEFAE